MAPSTGKSPVGTQTSSGFSQKLSTEILVGWPPQNAPPKVSCIPITHSRLILYNYCKKVEIIIGKGSSPFLFISQTDS